MKKLLLIVVVVLVVMQFFPIDKTNPQVVSSEDFFNMYNTPTNIQDMIKNSCYDCHSNETIYPWYSSIAPFSYLLKNHIEEGREHLNFSEFGTYNDQQRIKVLQEAAEEVEERKMPMGAYTLFHSNAKLDDSQREELVNYFNSISNQLSQ